MNVQFLPLPHRRVRSQGCAIRVHKNRPLLEPTPFPFSPTRGVYAFIGYQTPDGKTLVPGSQVSQEYLFLCGYDLDEGGWMAGLGAVGVHHTISVGAELGQGPIWLLDVPGGGVFYMPTEDSIGVYRHHDFGAGNRFTAGYGVYVDLNRLRNLFDLRYWSGDLPVQGESGR